MGKEQGRSFEETKKLNKTISDLDKRHVDHSPFRDPKYLIPVGAAALALGGIIGHEAYKAWRKYEANRNNEHQEDMPEIPPNIILGTD